MAIADIHAGRELFTVFSSSPMSGGERQPDAELKLDRALGKRIWRDRFIQFDQSGFLTLRMGGPDSQWGNLALAKTLTRAQRERLERMYVTCN